MNSAGLFISAVVILSMIRLYPWWQLSWTRGDETTQKHFHHATVQLHSSELQLKLQKDAYRYQNVNFFHNLAIWRMYDQSWLIGNHGTSQLGNWLWLVHRNHNSSRGKFLGIIVCVFTAYGNSPTYTLKKHMGEFWDLGKCQKVPW